MGKKFVYSLQNENLGTTSVDNLFINEIMYGADGDYVKVYLYGLKDSQNHTPVSLSDEEIAKTIGVDMEKYKKAWEYWKSMGIIDIKTDLNGDELVTFYNLKSLHDSDRDRLIFKVDDEYTVISVVEEARNVDPFEDLLEDLNKIVKTKGELTRHQIEEVRFWKNQYKFTIDLILYLFEYSFERVSPETTLSGLFRYMETVAASWNKEGIISLKDIRDKEDKNLSKVKTLGSKVKQKLGMYSGLMESEKNFVRKWLEKYRLSEELILEAASKSTVPNFKYIDGILSKWVENGWKTVEEVRASDKKPNRKEKSKKETKDTGTDFIYKKLDKLYSSN